MLIEVARILSTDRATLSEVRIGSDFICYGLEDPHQDKKIQGNTRIPDGMYKIRVRTWGGWHNRVSKSPHYPYHRGMLEVLDVPNFTDVLIHTGNKVQDTAGCLLVGQGYNIRGSDITIKSSRSAYKDLYTRVIDAAEQGDLQILYYVN